MNIQFIWCGKLGKIFLELFLEKGIKNEDIYIITGSKQWAQKIADEYSVQIGAAEKPALVFLGIKPQQLNEIDLTIYDKNTLIVSPLGWVKIDKINTPAKVFRILPNILLKYNYGTTLIYKNEESESLNWFLDILGAKGNIVNCKTEDELNELATISGCGPAYFFIFAKILEELWVKHGWGTESAKKTLENLFFGSALYSKKEWVNFTESIQNVASKWGITQKALDTFAEKWLKDIIDSWIIEAFEHWNKLYKSA